MKYAEILLTFLLFAVPAAGSQNRVSIVPEPREVTTYRERFLVSDSMLSLKIYLPDAHHKAFLASQIEHAIAEASCPPANGRMVYRRAIEVGIPGENVGFSRLCRRQGVRLQRKLGKEGYVLRVSRSGIIIAANTYTGVFYGVQSLKQLLNGSSGGYLQGLRIVDWPVFRYRSVLDDISRGPVPTMSFMEYQIRRLAELKINQLQYYIENVVLTKSHPEFAPRDGSISIHEWKELTRYARKYRITLVGNFQSFGHFQKILAVPRYANLGEEGTLLSPLRRASYKFLGDIYSEMVPAFDGSFFNVDCDETFDLGKGRSKQLADSLGYAEVYYLHIMKLREILKRLNVRLMMWADIPLKYPVLLEKLPKDIVLCTWTYDALKSYRKYIAPIRKEGFEFFVTPGVINSDKLYPNYPQTFENIKGFAQAGAKYGAAGLINAVWNDGGTAFFSNDWYGVAYGADKSWNPYQADSASFDYRFDRGIYGATNESFTQAIRELSNVRFLEPTDGMTDRPLFEKLLPDSGKQIRISEKGWKKVLRIAYDTEKLLNDVHLKKYSSDKGYLRFTAALYRSLAEERLDLFDASRSYAMADSIVRMNRMRARSCVIRTIKDLDSIVHRYTMIVDRYSQLWLSENHMFFLDSVTDRFEEKIHEYADVRDRVMASLDSLDSRRPLVGLDAVRLAVSKLPGKYFRSWLMVNPLPNADRSGNSEVDYLKGMGGEKYAVPSVAQEFRYDSVVYRWRRVTTGYQDVVNLSELFPGEGKYKVTYAFANIDVGSDTSVAAAAGAVAGIEVFIDGKMIFRSARRDSLSPDEYSFTMPLKKGRNNLLLKISRIAGPWGFTFRLPGSRVRNDKNRYYILP